MWIRLTDFCGGNLILVNTMPGDQVGVNGDGITYYSSRHSGMHRVRETPEKVAELLGVGRNQETDLFNKYEDALKMIDAYGRAEADPGEDASGQFIRVMFIARDALGLERFHGGGRTGIGPKEEK